MSEDPALDRRLPVPRKQRGAGIYVAYSIAAALLLGAGALSLGHLAAYRSARPTTGGSAVVQPPVPAAPASPTVSAQGQPPSPSPAAATPPPSVTLKLPTVAAKPADPKDTATPPPAAAPAPPVAAASPPPPSSTTPQDPPPAAAVPSVPSLPGAFPDVAAPPPAAPATAAADAADAPVNLIAANGLPLPPPEKPPAPGRRVGMCPPGTDLADLVEASPVGRLPRISTNGCMPWLAYAAQFDHLDRQRPRLGMAVIGIGLNEALTQKAVETLPPGTTLVFVPETPNLGRWIQRARERGLEAALLIPSQNPQGVQERGMPPLQKGLAPAENLSRLRAALAMATGYVGVALLPSPVLADNDTLRPLLAEIRDRGLLVLEFERWNGKSLVHAISREMGIPYSTDIDSPIAWVDRFNTNGREMTAADIDAGITQVEKYVRSARFGLGWSLARPLSIERIAAWSAGAHTRGILLAPVTGVTECAESCQKRLPRAPKPPAAAPAR
jgi:polysaccharide deacetylase 2 family uncharacterized protein YibQ